MDTHEFWTDFHAWKATLKKEPKDTIDSSNCFDGNQENSDPQKYHFKENLDLKWDEKDNDYDINVDNEGGKDMVNTSTSIRQVNEGNVKLENSDSEIDKTYENSSIQKYIYKEEVDLAWDETDNNNYDSNHLTDISNSNETKKNKLSTISRNKNSHPQERNIKIDDPDSEKECPKCKKRLKNQNTLAKHLYYCGKEPHLQCDSCSYKAKYKNALITHIQRNHPQQIPKIRRKAAPKRGNKKSRKEHELSDKCLRFCITCNVSIDNPKINKCHKCESQLLYQCRKCNEFFRTREKLTRHTIDRCDPKGYYHCTACKFKSTSKRKAIAHMKVHLTPGSHVDVKDIKWKRVEGKTPNSQLFACPSCDRSFQRQASLSSHMRFCFESQSVSKPPMQYLDIKDAGSDNIMTRYCIKCDKDYPTPKFKIQKNECCGSVTLFKCFKCNKCYDRAVSLHSHMINSCYQHVKYKCDKCNYEGSKYNLQRHNRKVHDLKKVECPKCKKIVKNKYCLRNHLYICGKPIKM